MYAAGQSSMYHVLGCSAQVNGQHGYTGSRRRCCRACDEVKQDEYDDGCDDEVIDHDDDCNHYDGGGLKYDDEDYDNDDDDESYDFAGRDDADDNDDDDDDDDEYDGDL